MRPVVLYALLVAPLCAALQSDIEYCKAGDVSLKMDAWIPDGAGPFPTVILVHGGGWQGGDKQKSYTPFFDTLTQAGFAWFTVDYRLAPKYHYPAAVDDVVAAIRYIEAHARDYKLDLERIALTGESAGGQIVAYIGARYGNELRLACVAPFYPVTDFEALIVGKDKNPNAVQAGSTFLGISDPHTAAARQLMRDASPVTYVQTGLPPFLFVHGTGDATVAFHQSEDMCARLKEAGSRCEIYAVDGAPHGIGRWEGHPGWLGYKQKVPEWIAAQFGRNKK